MNEMSLSLARRELARARRSLLASPLLVARR